MPKAVNDNIPRDATSFTSLAERRAWLAAQADKPVERNRNRSWPTGARLQRARAFSQLDALRRYSAGKGVDIADGFGAANDNSPQPGTEEPEINRIDQRIEQCTEEELIAAVNAGDAEIVIVVDFTFEHHNSPGPYLTTLRRGNLAEQPYTCICTRSVAFYCNLLSAAPSRGLFVELP
ncbi:MAG: hypothetical protein J0H89_06190 [Rhizobiales bacterium]|nr:hypothetical protein [Hyphomicrobiales bacterium]